MTVSCRSHTEQSSSTISEKLQNVAKSARRALGCWTTNCSEFLDREQTVEVNNDV